MKTITTQKANCRDCHRCMRSCPVKAVGIVDGQARLIDEKCVQCGRCVVECPQGAKQVASHVAAVKDAILAGRFVVISLAPSFVAAFPEYTLPQLTAKLGGLGISLVEETAVGAEEVSRFYSNLLTTADKPIISACCPVVVNVVTKYYPDLIGNLAPVDSPMLVHAKMLKQRLGDDAYVVFAGPCIAKLAESRDPESLVDAAITFRQLREWLAEENKCDLVPPATSVAAPGPVRYYPIAGGILKSFVRSESTATDIIAIDGLENCLEVLAALRKGEIAPRFIEALACSGGCINGPASGCADSVPAKRLKVAEFAVAGSARHHKSPPGLDFSRRHTLAPVREYMPPESRIREVLRQTGKYSKEDEKNCGACGFNSCRDKAIAVCQGLTEIDTCVPYMRSKAESLANFIVQHSLNAIIVIDSKMIVQEFNPAAEKMLNRQQELIKGGKLGEVLDCREISAAIVRGEKLTDRRVNIAGGTIVNETIIPVPEHDLVIVVLTDITAQEKNARELEQMKLQTVEKATEIINKQMHVAQEIAGLLGETTAETKAALLELVSLLKAKGKN
ncbi:[Fe-Fe] hydrogenase large subunit C-terminal domain-containing protein [Anaeroselena agilis]|uniref:[Fe-Fe] hydrogenase large subunit C-terminal domain-containing protein n=1 Tax=Anaeroselena agilis TaxID=3063788 RepID=A0ABU3NW24_9FIRM|nr:[Fe-Fe] hydrogenase large subunit C-terminal domain-containing protein [Selenomonadales bacterium 4137-cl]